MAVNVSSGQLSRPGLAADVVDALDRNGLDPEDLALEITETTAFRDPELALAELTALADAGVRLVDRSLVTRVTGDSRAGFIVPATVAAALELELDVLAEGIEDDRVRRFISAA